ncbi:Unknown protein [Striga hermonthica]|uniref:CCHC-type domain-containing protein n=1 Tax=Striga hermonthica TaxID=68872 RepID=A0A9N7NYB1_STRHE|nr:Unknown protein [Striga hermonthica]
MSTQPYRENLWRKKGKLNGLNATLRNIWITKQPFRIKNLGQNEYQFLFQNADDKERILYEKSWSFDGQYLLLKPWQPNATDFKPEEEKIKMWVQIHNLPLHWIGLETGYKIGKLFSKLHDVVVPGNGSSNGKVMKLLVDLQLNEPVLRGTHLKLGTDSTWVEFKYENIQNFCYYCGRIGHGDKNCSSKRDDANRSVLNIGQYGDWLRTFSGSLSDYKNDSPSPLVSQPSVKDSKNSLPPVANPNLETNAEIDKSNEAIGNSMGDNSVKMTPAESPLTPSPQAPIVTVVNQPSPLDSIQNPSQLVDVDIQSSNTSSRPTQKK